MQVQRHWEALETLGPDSPWSEVVDEFFCDPADFQERHYKEFVTFLPYVQRFLYGSTSARKPRNGMASRACACSVATTWRACA